MSNSTKSWIFSKELRKKKGITILPHNTYLEEAETLADRIAILHKGKFSCEVKKNFWSPKRVLEVETDSGKQKHFHRSKRQYCGENTIVFSHSWYSHSRTKTRRSPFGNDKSWLSHLKIRYTPLSFDFGHLTEKRMSLFSPVCFWRLCLLLRLPFSILSVLVLPLSPHISLIFWVPYLAFYRSGLILLSSNNAFQNPSSSLIISKISLESISISPGSTWVPRKTSDTFWWNYSRNDGFFVICGSTFVPELFPDHPFLLLLMLFLANGVFHPLGTIVGILGNTFDQISGFTTFIITPMGF